MTASDWTESSLEPRAERQHVFIGVMGVTGAGKSTFIKTVTGNDDIVVGHDLRSCTTEVMPYTFEHEAVTVTLIDTPGFNDTTRGETEVLRDIAEWLDITYRNPPSIRLSGIIYMQSISDNRMYGSSLRNLKMFRDLCGENPMKNVIFATTGWRLAKEGGQYERAVERETQLCTERLFWEPMIRFGAGTARFEDSRESGIKIIRKLIPQRPVVLQIQHELVDQDRNLIDTTAGATVNEEIKRLEAQYQQQLREIQREMAEALKTSDLEHQQALEETKATIEFLREQTRQARDILNYERRNMDRRHENEMQSLQNALQDTRMALDNQRRRAQAEAAAQRYEDQMRFEQIVTQLKENMTKLRQEDQKLIEEAIANAQKEHDKLPAKGRKRDMGKKLLLGLLPLVGNVVMAAMGFGFIGNPFAGITQQ
ncbi:hypothetical protein HRR83_003601 [Exophiala dermatitidis]|uniref:G domain-containing protein n=2 Tax=Exophiala dermatitidis TaxID=5970 RepID=H6BSP2_EXODN|nr:uncharacterized protein HMPREF1120_01588 [Exophiala dermatitidis NIH/UT8656]KAJ4519087.1 hypothetical protein HRR75_002765 [Exophiala dermatitidis]EHY53394.1 hypothetical protein HMPREF1120_01588 [Exophiala dermatitidis NIH/UT8656]KAJ4557264.1 hypothetical protein HRR78_000931 [Exophiala dermatitidis]KAJ4598853.1 hypothetical protein HRR83_003601 [Exophiala dermatitidis]KAJ4694942.1 hypothetical protein HRR87_003988 [Exophiala dermatitidis]